MQLESCEHPHQRRRGACETSGDSAAPGSYIRCIDRSDRSNDTNDPHATWNQRRAGERERGASGGSEHGEGVNAKSVGKFHNITGPVDNVPARKEVRATHSGAVWNDHASIELGNRIRRHGEVALDARTGSPVAVEDGRSMRTAEFQVSERTAAAQADFLVFETCHIGPRGWAGTPVTCVCSESALSLAAGPSLSGTREGFEAWRNLRIRVCALPYLLIIASMVVSEENGRTIDCSILRTPVRNMKIVGKLAGGVAALVLVVILAALVYRTVMQRRIAREVRITASNGINEAKYIKINGVQEWITIRGDDRKNPVILFLHGGPAEANSPFVPLFLPYERDYVLVQWDQPGAGKTYIKVRGHQPKLTLRGMASDGIAVAEYVRGELHQRKAILIGQDWGGVLGIRMIEKRPDLFSAFVGTGQVVGDLATQRWQYQYALVHSTAGHDEKMLAALKQVGPPPYRTRERYGQFQDCCRNPFWSADDVAGISRLKGFLVFSPSLSIREIFGWLRALRTDEDELDRMLMTMDDLRNTDTKFAVPIFFIQGENDNVTPTSLVADYEARIRAPAKRVDVVPNAGHFVMWTYPREFLTSFREDLRSVAADAAAAVDR
jgi:pimeloyl-ACP methyl ester carboxylesterase